MKQEVALENQICSWGQLFMLVGGGGFETVTLSTLPYSAQLNLTSPLRLQHREPSCMCREVTHPPLGGPSPEKVVDLIWRSWRTEQNRAERLRLLCASSSPPLDAAAQLSERAPPFPAASLSSPGLSCDINAGLLVQEQQIHPVITRLFSTSFSRARLSTAGSQASIRGLDSFHLNQLLRASVSLH